MKNIYRASIQRTVLPIKRCCAHIYCYENTFIDFCQLKKTGYKKVYREESNFGKSDVYGNEKGKI